MTNKVGRPLANPAENDVIQNIKEQYLGEHDENIMITFATRLNKELSKKKIKGEELSKKVGISTGLLSEYRNGKSIPKVPVLARLAYELNCSTDYLLGLTDLKTRDIKIKEINDVTGLSDEAINILKDMIDLDKLTIERENQDIVEDTKNGFIYISEDGAEMNSKEIEKYSRDKLMHKLYNPIIEILNFLIENEYKYHLLDKLELYIMKPRSIKIIYDKVTTKWGKDFLEHGEHRGEWLKESKKLYMEQDVAKVKIEEILYEIKNEMKEKYKIEIPNQKD